MKMNTKKKITADTAIEDFKKILVFHLVNKIETFFDGNVRAFWEAQKQYGKFCERLETYGRQSQTYTHKVFENLELFDRCSFPLKALKAIFRNVPNYSKLVSKYRVAQHGTLPIGAPDENGKRQLLHYGNIYRTETMKELTDIFDNQYLLKAILNLRGNHYTKRQKHIILKFIAPKKEGNKEFKLEEHIKQKPACVENLDVDELDDEELDDFFSDNENTGD